MKRGRTVAVFSFCVPMVLISHFVVVTILFSVRETWRLDPAIRRAISLLSLPNGFSTAVTTPFEDEDGQPYWENLRPAEHCLRYATRDYTALLTGIPYGPSAVAACRETKVEIHGEELLPDFCQDLGFRGGIWGHWTVSTDEIDCITQWKDMQDKGCRVISSRVVR
ncbi:hypothetical protein CC2G_011209 [Coprinopsis cinerea AmutBmut pab1-1]|nr:hypothetical protein CC2G_011209 [Coprinopsis cinerea AmutBmut pab1-1]